MSVRELQKALQENQRGPDRVSGYSAEQLAHVLGELERHLDGTSVFPQKMAQMWLDAYRALPPAVRHLPGLARLRRLVKAGTRRGAGTRLKEKK
jgi:hypothetical protein